MIWWHIIWLIGSVLIGVWTLLEIRKEPPAAKLLVLFVGVGLMMLWPIVLATVLVIAIWALMRELWTSAT